MQDFFDYLFSIIIIPIIMLLIMVFWDIFAKMPFVLKGIGFIAGFIFLTYLIPYFLRAFCWALIPGYVIVFALKEYDVIPWLADKEVRILPPTKEVLICTFILALLIQVLTRNYLLKEDRRTNDPIVPFARNRYTKSSNVTSNTVYNNKIPGRQAMKKTEKHPIGFIWDEDKKKK